MAVREMAGVAGLASCEASALATAVENCAAALESKATEFAAAPTVGEGEAATVGLAGSVVLGELAVEMVSLSVAGEGRPSGALSEALIREMNRIDPAPSAIDWEICWSFCAEVVGASPAV